MPDDGVESIPRSRWENYQLQKNSKYHIWDTMTSKI